MKYKAREVGEGDVPIGTMTETTGPRNTVIHQIRKSRYPMTRVKRGVNAHKKREKLLTYVKGFKWGRKTKERAAKEALLHAWSHAFQGRKQKKRDYRALWVVQINAALRALGTTYSRFIDSAAKANIQIDRKVLSEIAKTAPNTFAKIVTQANTAAPAVKAEAK